MEKAKFLRDAFLVLEERGVSRRDFMKLCAGVVALAGLSTAQTPKVAEALSASVIGATNGNLYPVIWLEGASCSGCIESFAKGESPDVASIILEMLSLNYSDVLQAGAGESVEKSKAQTLEAGNYILVHEGAVLQAFEGQTLRYAGKTGAETLKTCAEGANCVIAVGSCSVNGGWCAATPNPSNACGVEKFLRNSGIDTKVINIPGCPVNPEYITSILVNLVYMKEPSLIELTEKGYPSEYFSQTIHENCERRGHFENGEFVYEYGSEEEKLGYCLYPLGCKGPQTKNKCGVVRWNNGRSWCIQAGCPCIGCCEADPFDLGHSWVEVNTPFASRFRNLNIGSFKFQPEVAAVIATGVVGAALVVHGFGMKAAGRTKGGADFEKIRDWDKKHPDSAIGKYADRKEGGELANDELYEKNAGHKLDG